MGGDGADAGGDGADDAVCGADIVEYVANGFKGAAGLGVAALAHVEHFSFKLCIELGL